MPRRDSGLTAGGALRFLDHIRNEESPGTPVGSHHAFFSDDQEPPLVTDIADLIRDSYEVAGPCLSHCLRAHARETGWAAGVVGLCSRAQERPISLQKFGHQSVEQIERMRCRHRMRVLQSHESTTKQNVVSEASMGWRRGWEWDGGRGGELP